LNSSFLLLFCFTTFVIKRLLLTFVCSVFKEQLIGRSTSDFINLTHPNLRVNYFFIFLFIDFSHVEVTFINIPR
ncbi:hypothetical protein, partial [Niallia circulans]|uniref:hypothetical protein n=1 Tax=Niallia circulans TaxID=1397 RepID=UPI002E1D6C2D|nr:hypothetical protein [Niallia circulans]